MPPGNDLLGDWREEVVCRSEDNTELPIHTTTDPTDRRIVKLMHDPIYRLAVAWQSRGYNIPPHPSVYIGANLPTPPLPDNITVPPRPRRPQLSGDNQSLGGHSTETARPLNRAVPCPSRTVSLPLI